MSKIKIAILGAGYMAREHIKAFKSIPDVSIAGIYSRTKSKAEVVAKEFDIGFVCCSITELYEKTQADLVIIAVPVLKTKEIVLEALAFPWIQLIEKPIGCNVEEAEEIIAAFKASSNTGYAAFNRRFYSSTKTVIKEQEDNPSKRFINVYDQEDPTASWEESREQKLINNWMYVNPIHLIDYFRVLGRGEIISVKPVIRWDSENPFIVVSQLEYSSGDIGVYKAVWGAPGPWAVTVTTKEKRWEIRPLEQLSLQLYGSRQIANIPVDKVDVDFKAGLLAQAQETIKALKNQDNSLTTLEDALATMKLVQRIYQ
jgi:predicted dehydrogenase